jgi:pilus assembly protein CpaF
MMVSRGSTATDSTEEEATMTDLTQPQIDFGPLQALMDDDDVRAIMVNGPQQVYVVRHREQLKAGVTFRDNEHIVELINRLLTAVAPNTQISADFPHADARFPDGTRLQAFIPPIAVSGPSLTIRKAIWPELTFENLLGWGTLTEDIADFLAACVKVRLNIVATGNVGGGKTTLLSVLASVIPAEERIVTVEEEAEFRLRQEHVVALEHRPPNRQGKGEISVRDLLRMIPRIIPNRILIGELNGPEALEALRLMDKGYDGTMTTIFGDSPQEALDRLEMRVKLSDPHLPTPYLRSLIGSAVDLIVQQNRLEDGRRKVVRITEVLTVRGGDYDLHDVFVFLQEGFESGQVVGRFESHPVSVGLMRRMEALGIALPPSLVVATAEQEVSEA